MRRIIPLALLLGVTCLGPLTAATILEMTTRDLTASPPTAERSVVTVGEQFLRVDADFDADDSPTVSTIYNGEAGNMTVLLHDRHQAMLLDRNTGDELAARMAEVRKQWETALSQVPDSNQETARQMLEKRFEELGAQSAPSSPVEIRRTADTGSTNGHDWVRYEAIQDGLKVREFLVAGFDSVPGGEATIEVIAHMAGFLEDMTRPLEGKVELDNPFRDIGNLTGFPVVIRHFRDGELVEESIVEAAREAPVEPDVFANPGYPVQNPWQMPLSTP